MNESVPLKKPILVKRASVRFDDDDEGMMYIIIIDYILV